MTQAKMRLSISEDDEGVGYLYLSIPDRLVASSKVQRQIRLSDILSYEGAEIYLDLDGKGRLVGMEILDTTPSDD